MNAVLADRCDREILLIECNNCACSATDSSRENMAVVCIRKGQRVDEWFVTGDAAVRNGCVHGGAARRQLFDGNPALSADGIHPLSMDMRTPPGAKKSTHGQFQEQARQPDAKENV